MNLSFNRKSVTVLTFIDGGFHAVTLTFLPVEQLQSDLLVLELRWIIWGLKALFKHTSAVVMREERVQLFHRAQCIALELTRTAKYSSCFLLEPLTTQTRDLRKHAYIKTAYSSDTAHQHLVM